MPLVYQFKPVDIIAQNRTKRRAIELIDAWVDEPNQRTKIPKIPQELIVLFLLSCNNVLENTKKTIVAYYECKKNAPELFDDRDVDREDLKIALSTIHMSSIPKRTPLNHVVHFFKLFDTSVYRFDLVPIMKASYMLLDVAQERNPPDGLIVIIDMKGFSLFHLAKLKYGAIKKYVQFLEQAFPIQLKTIHILNTVYFFDQIMSIVKMFMKSELIDMIKSHPPNMDMEKFFHEHVPAECIPGDYGGKLEMMEELNRQTVEAFTRLKPFYKAEEEMRKNIGEDEVII